MSKEREAVTAQGTTRVLTAEERQMNELKNEARARIVRVMERGYIVDRLTVENLPPDMYGEWVSTDPLEIERKKALGFTVDTEFAPKRSLHSDGSGSAIVADCVFMICPKYVKDVIDEERYKAFVKRHGSPADKKRQSQKEEQEFAAMMAGQTGLPVIDEGRETKSSAAELTDAVKSTQPK